MLLKESNGRNAIEQTNPVNSSICKAMNMFDISVNTNYLPNCYDAFVSLFQTIFLHHIYIQVLLYIYREALHTRSLNLLL